MFLPNFEMSHYIATLWAIVIVSIIGDHLSYVRLQMVMRTFKYIIRVKLISAVSNAIQ